MFCMWSSAAVQRGTFFLLCGLDYFSFLLPSFVRRVGGVRCQVSDGAPESFFSAAVFWWTRCPCSSFVNQPVNYQTFFRLRISDILMYGVRANYIRTFNAARESQSSQLCSESVHATTETSFSTTGSAAYRTTLLTTDAPGMIQE